ncbi:hypothetical protein VNI00_003514 [Paramarasmius palmivorus]|uniref:Uncharacterized protein n=1 Tax=Paramarasmius palmivorus TaxID=297713 RepID=A0AAW0DTX6_9AGAR
MRSRDKTGERRHKNLYLILTVVLFALSTIFVVNHTAYYVHGAIIRFDVVKNEDYNLLEQYQEYNDFERRLGSSTEILVPVVLNVAAEWMLIHRCYLIWGSSKVVAVPLIVASVFVNACGLSSSILLSVGISALVTLTPNAPTLLVLASDVNFAYQVTSAVNNLIITLLTANGTSHVAGRIWWIHREVRRQGVHISNKVQSISRVILESGMIYPVTIIASLILANIIPPETYAFDPLPLVSLSAGIAPTLIMVRAKLGKNIESLQDVSTDIQFVSRPAQREPGGTSTFGSQV